MKEPNPKDYPPKTPHDLEWGGVNQQYYADVIRYKEWVALTTNAQKIEPMRKSLFGKQMEEFDKTPDEDNVHLAQRKPETILIDKELYDDLIEYLTDNSDADWEGEETGYTTNRAMKLLARLDKEKF